MKTKICSKCKEELPISEFHRNKTHKDGLTSACKRCRKIESKNYLKTHKEQRKKYAEEYRKNNYYSLLQSKIKYNRSHKGRFKMYKESAKRRNLKFDMTLQFFDYLTKQPCVYCGGYSKHGYNGLDRIKSDKGYVSGNVCPCCPNCNYAKGKMNMEQYIRHICKVHKHISS